MGRHGSHTIGRSGVLLAGVVLAVGVACGDNTKPEPGGLVLTPATDLVTTEAGGQATFTIALTTQPYADVMIPLASSDPTEGTVSPANLTFTSANWNAPQLVTVTGVDDDAADGPQIYRIATGAAVSTDEPYRALDGADAEVTNGDDETPGILVAPTDGLTTTEAGGQATFTIVLGSQPEADVTIDVASNDATEGLPSPASVTFTTLNWQAPQTVTVTGVGDDEADATVAYAIVTAPAASADPGYLGLDASDVAVRNVDDDSPGITVTPIDGLVTTEAGGQAFFTIVLNSRPTDVVTIALASDAEDEGTATPANVTFTPDDWNAPQTVTVQGVDDDGADGGQPYTIVTAPALSRDPGYVGRDADDVSVTNTDDDSPGITVTPTSGLTTTEAGGQATFTLVLNSQPTADVTLGVGSSDPSEGTVSPASVTFTSANWSAPRTVTITGVDDDAADGNQPYLVRTAAAVSADAGYAGTNPPDVSLTNTDNDSPGITVTPTTGLVTTEAGGQASFTVVLNSQPAADVTVALGSSDPGEGTVGPATLTFTPVNWNAPQQVTLTGTDDFAVDGNQPYFVQLSPAVSTDAGYLGLNPTDVLVSNTDNDSPGITVTPTGGLVTTEAGGDATFTLVLNAEPTGDVTIGLSSSDPSEGAVSPASVTFTLADWNAPQVVTVTGQNDAAADADQPYVVITAQATGGDPAYATINPPDVAVTNVDDDSPGVTVDPTSGLVTTEAGGQAFFTIVLNSQPAADVTIGLVSSDPGEGTPNVASVAFTTVDWATPQTVTVTGVGDSVVDGNQLYAIQTTASSADATYAGLAVPDVGVSNTDAGAAGITIDPITDVTTSEFLTTDTFTVVLNAQPTADVTINLTSSDLGEGTVTPSVTFTPANWFVPQEVTVTGVDDPARDGNQVYSIITSQAVSADPDYAAINPPNVACVNVDNESAQVFVRPSKPVATTEAGTLGVFRMQLTIGPTSDVTCPVTSLDPTEGTVSVASVVFTPANGTTPIVVTVTGVDDALSDGSQRYTIDLAACTSADANYDGENPKNVKAVNHDDEP